jgi:RNA polymerase sigma-70 factor (ECF subfamily)
MTAVAVHDDERLCDALRRGDEQAFAELVGRYHTSLVRVAMLYVRNAAVAEEVAQETWLGVLGGLDRFERRSSLKTWIFRILTNRAKTRAERESRTVPFSALARDDEDAGPAVEPDRFLDASHPTWPGHWASPPESWAGVPEGRLLAGETRDVIREAIKALPPMQAQVIALRDVEGWSAPEVCALLEISEANQRVLLHRARSKVRAALERYL